MNQLKVEESSLSAQAEDKTIAASEASLSLSLSVGWWGGKTGNGGMVENIYLKVGKVGDIFTFLVALIVS